MYAMVHNMYAIDYTQGFLRLIMKKEMSKV